MEAFSSTQKVQVEGEKEDLVVYVEELSGEGDYWLSITDAARVCRVQDVSIRRAIARGALPVRRQRAGQNKRTRFVRASDLPAVGFPIIDESAAITTEIGKADILSIPRQQQRIQQDHQILMTRLQEMQEVLENTEARLLSALQQQKTDAETGLQALREEQARQLADAETRLRQQQETLQQSLTTAEQRLSQELQAAREAAAQSDKETLQREAALQAMINEQKEAFVVSQQEAKQALADLEGRQQQQALAYQQTMAEQFQQTGRETQARFAALEQQFTGRLEAQARMIEEQFASLTQQLSQLQQFSESLKQEITLQKTEQIHFIQLQQAQGEQLARMVPLLPYAGQSLLTEQDRSAWMQAFSNLEQKLFAEQQNEFARYQPLLTLLTPERLTTLARLLDEKKSSEREMET